MITVETTQDELIIRVPVRDALAFSALVDDAQRVRVASPAEQDFRQRVAALVTQAVVELMRYRPRP